MANMITNKIHCYKPKTIDHESKKILQEVATDKLHMGVHTTTTQFTEITSKWQAGHCKSWK
jgi:hypothetical protein